MNATAYDDDDIEGATFWNVYGDLKDAQYHLVDAASFERLVAASGINADSTVVFHDQIGVSPRPSTRQITNGSSRRPDRGERGGRLRRSVR